MNFYISNSSKIKIVAAVAIFIFLMTSLNSALNLYAARKTTQQSWIENKLSKSKHFQLLEQHDLDYIFIGSSRTIFHIDTDMFKRKGLKIYNFGVSGMVLTDYPHFVHEAIKAKPKAIVLNMSIQQLYQPSMQDDFKEVTTTDLRYIYKTQPWEIKHDSTLAYIKHWHSLLGYAEAMYMRVKKISKSSVIHFTSELDKIDKMQSTRSLDIGCKVFDTNYVSDHKTVLKCSNGDGILLGNSIKSDYLGEEKNLTRLNPDYMRLLNALVHTIQAANITPIIILEPVLAQRYSYHFNTIKQNISDAYVYDFTHIYGLKDYWADTSHFNHKGRRYYSDALIRLLLLKKANN